MFAKTGIGYLKPATEDDKVTEMTQYESMLRKLRERAEKGRAEREAASLDSSQL